MFSVGSCGGGWWDYTSDDDVWLWKESDDLSGVEDLLFVSQGLS